MNFHALVKLTEIFSSLRMTTCLLIKNISKSFSIDNIGARAIEVQLLFLTWKSYLHCGLEDQDLSMNFVKGTNCSQ